MAIHSQFTGLEIHEAFHYVQESDPGAVGANLYWLKVSTGVLNRRSAANDAWNLISPPAASPLTTKGDLLGFSSSVGRIAVGSNGKVLTADSTNSFGISWQTVSGSSSPTWVVNSPDTPPGSPNVLDDEFTTSASLPGGGSAQWTWDNQGSASVALAPNGQGIVLTVLSPGGVSNHLRTIYETAPTTPWEFTTKVALNAATGTDYFICGIVAFESSTGKKLVFDIGHDTSDKIQAVHWTDSNTFGAEVFSSEWFTKIAYLKLADNGTNLICSASVDGLAYYPFYGESRTSYMTGGANRIGLCGNNANATLNSFNSFHWFRRTV